MNFENNKPLASDSMGSEQELNPNLDENLSVEELHQKISNLTAELATVEEKAKHNWELLLRAKAEEENSRRRSRLELEHAHKYGIEKFAKSMLGVVDSLELGISSATKALEEPGVNQNISSLAEGMELTFKLLLSNLEEFGISIIDPIGVKFDPNQHEAIGMQGSEGAIPNSIIQVVQKGFMIHERVLRPARVIVAK